MPVTLRAGDLGKIERKSAPAAADVEHLGARLDLELGGKMTLLGELRVVERLVRTSRNRRSYIAGRRRGRAVEPAVEIVMMRDIAPRPRPRIELLHAPEQVAGELQRQCPSRRGDVILPQQDRKQIRDRALVDDESAVHVGFAQSSWGLKRTLRCAFSVVKRTATGGPLPSPKAYVLPAAVVTVRDPWRMNRRKNIASNQSSSSPRTSSRRQRRMRYLGRHESPSARLPLLKQNPP